MGIRKSLTTENKGTRPQEVFSRPGIFRISVIAEDLAAPLDEGAKKTCFNIIRSIEKKGAVVSVFTHPTNDPLFNNAFSLPENKLLLGAQFSKKLRELSPDAILYIPTSSGTIGAFVRAAVIKMQSNNKPLALVNLQYRDLPGNARFLGLQRFVDIVFAQSQPSLRMLQSFGCKTVLLSGAVDSSVFRPVDATEKVMLRSQYGFQAADKILLHVGHLNNNRNVSSLANLVDAGFNVILIASTSTPIDQGLLARLQQAGVLVITDFVENVQHYYQLADCYLFPVFQALSAIDTPLSVLEAMACNIPIVSTRFGALPSMFQPGNGLYFVNSEEEIAPTLKKAVEEKNCGTFEMVYPYSWDCTASTILDTLQEAAN